MIEQSVESDRVANVAGFNLHAGVMSDAQDRNKLERLFHYITRSADVAIKPERYNTDKFLIIVNPLL